MDKLRRRRGGSAEQPDTTHAVADDPSDGSPSGTASRGRAPATGSDLVGFTISDPNDIDAQIAALLDGYCSLERVAQRLNADKVCVPAQRIPWTADTVGERVRRNGLHSERSQRLEDLRKLRFHPVAPLLVAQAVAEHGSDAVVGCLSQEVGSSFDDQRVADLLETQHLDASENDWR